MARLLPACRARTRLPVRPMSLVLVLSLALSLIVAARPAWAADGGPPARRVYGQPDFTSNVPNNNGSGQSGAPTMANLSSPWQVAVDASGGLYVGDNGNGRVLYFPAGSTTATRIYPGLGYLNPTGLAVDSRGVFIADFQRVYFYPGTSTTSTRTYEIDQEPAVSGIAVDGNGGLYVTRWQGGLVVNQVLYFEGDSTTPSRVYQSDCSVTGARMCAPIAVAVNAMGVWIAANHSHEIYFFPGTSTTYTAVYRYPGPGDANGWFMKGIAVDPAGNLYVSDKKHRVVYFPWSSTARAVYGQPSLSSTTCNTGGFGTAPTASTLCSPQQVALDPAGNLYVADASNNRVLVFAKLPAISIANATDVVEGNSGTTSATFKVRLSTASAAAVTVGYTTVNGTGPMGAQAGRDYLATSGTIQFAPGTREQTITVPVVGDTTDEVNRYFTVSLTSTTPNAVIAKATAKALIIDDDPPRITIGDATVIEGNSGRTTATFSVTLSTADASPVTISYATADRSARAGADYAAIPTTTLTFAPGERVKTISVSVLGDTLDEQDETFYVKLFDVTNGTLARAQGVGRIRDDDVPAVAIRNLAQPEGQSGTTPFSFTVTLTSASPVAVTVNYATTNGSAKAGLDYTTTSGTLTIPAGATRGPIVVPVLGDTVPETQEYFVVRLSSAANATIADDGAVGRITNDD